MRLIPIALLVIAAGCKPLEVNRPPTPATELDGGQTVRVVVEEAIGPAPLEVTVRALNGFGAPVASVAQSVNVDGTPISVSFDGWGYGVVELTDLGTHEISTGTETVEAHVVDSDWSTFGLLEAWPATDDEPWLVREVSTGFVVAGRQHVWWVGPGHRPHQVLEVPAGEIQGMRSGDLDTDGIMDALAWTSEQVYLLRGRPDGGMGWGTGMTATGYAVAGADIGDVSDDTLPDAVIAWAGSENNNWIDIWQSDGLWTFAPVPPRLMQSNPTSLAIGDNTDGGIPQITVTNDELSWERFVEGDETKYMPIGPQLDLNVPVDATVETGWDINNDGGDELFFFGPRFENSPREILIFDFIGTNPEYLTLNQVGAYLHVSDTNNDGFGDLMQLPSSGQMSSLSYVGGSYSTRQSADYADPGPFSMVDLDKDPDRIPEMLMASPGGWRWYEGSQNSNGSESWWTHTEPTLGNADQRLDSPPIAAEVDGNSGTVDLVGIELRTGVTSLVIWTHSTSSPTSAVFDSATLSNTGAQPLDLAVCGDVAWALTNGTLTRVTLSSGGATVTGSLSTTATRVACGAGPFGSRATVLEPQELVHVDNGLNVLGTTAAAGAEDVAVLADETTAVCEEEDCTIEPFGDGWAIGGATAACVDCPGMDGDVDLGVSGDVSVVDVDGDGNDDLLFTSSSDVALFRSTGAGLGPVESWHSLTELIGPATAGDITGDGQADLWVRNGSSELIYTLAPESWVTEPEDEDTGQ